MKENIIFFFELHRNILHSIFAGLVYQYNTYAFVTHQKWVCTMYVIGNFTLHKHESLITFMALVFSPIVMILLWTTSECQYIHPTNNGEWDSWIAFSLWCFSHFTHCDEFAKNILAFWKECDLKSHWVLFSGLRIISEGHLRIFF